MTTVATILQPDLGAIGSRVAGVLSQVSAVRRLPATTRAAVLDQVTSSLTLQDISIGNAISLAFSASARLLLAGRRSVKTGQPQTVRIDGYSVPIDYEPAIDVLVNGTRVATVSLRLRVGLELAHLQAQVAQGRLVGLSCDTFDVLVSVAIFNHTIAARRARLQPAVELPLPPGGLPLQRQPHGSKAHTAHRP